MRSACFRVPALMLLFAVPATAPAGKFNKTLSVGDAAPSWVNLTGTDDQPHALADWKDKPVVVVVFTCNSCPVAEGYEDRIIGFAKTHPDVGVVAVNVNTGPADNLLAMKLRAAKKKFPYPYLFDPTQEVARKYGAVFTPEFFVLNKARRVVYMGAMDDKAPPGTAKLHHLEAAVSAALSDKAATPAETSAAAGCRIKYNPKKSED